MHFVIKSLGVFFDLIGIAYLLWPGLLKHLMNFFKQGSRIYLPALVRLILAAIFFYGARECRRPWLIYTSGAIFLADGLLIFALGPRKIRWIFDWYEDQPTLIFRIIALVVIIFGSLIIASV